MTEPSEEDPHDREQRNPLLWSTFRHATAGMLVLKASDHRILLANDTAALLLGRERRALEGMQLEDLYMPGESDRLGSAPITPGVRGRLSEHVTFVQPDGKSVRCDISFSLFGDLDEVYAVCVLGEPNRVPHMADVADALLRHSTEGIVLTDTKGDVIWVNDAWCEKTGYSAEEAQGRNQRFLKSGIQDETFYREMWASLGQYGTWDGELWNRRKDGVLYCECLRIRRIEIPSAGAAMYLGMIRDVSQIHDLKQRLTHSENFDGLTGLPTRRHFERRLSDEMARADTAGRTVNVLWIAVHGLRHINHTLGLRAGDQLVSELGAELRSMAASPMVAGRMSGHEFAVLQTAAAGTDEALTLANQIRKAFLQPRLAGQAPGIIAVTTGIFIASSGSNDAEFALRAASATAALARDAGTDLDIYRENMIENLRSDIQILSSIDAAMSDGSLFLVFQPKITLRTKAVEGVEALLRWRQPDGSLLSPARWIPLIEHTERMHRLQDWIMTEALRWAGRFRESGLRLRVSINIAATTVSSSRFAESVNRIMDRMKIPASEIQFEITESGLMHERDAAIAQMRELAARGIRFSIDDFGTGYSSLGQVRELPAAELKLDRSFSHGVHGDGALASLARAAIGIARSFNMHTVAEGVESRADAAYLARCGCDAIQGHYFYEPLDGDELVRRMKEDGGRTTAQLQSGEHADVVVYGFSRQELSLLEEAARSTGITIRATHDRISLLDTLACVETSAVLARAGGSADEEFSLLSELCRLYPMMHRAIALPADIRHNAAHFTNRFAVTHFIDMPFSEEEVAEWMASLDQHTRRISAASMLL